MPPTQQNPPSAQGSAQVLISLIGRELRNRFIDSAAGWLWLIVNPLLLLGVYSVVFGVIFQARAPQALDVPFVAWLALGLWPWLAFADAIQRAAESMPEHAALISKVPLKREQLTIAAGTAAFLLQLVGFVFVLLVLAAFGVPLHPAGLPAVVVVLAVIWLLGTALGLFAAAIRVYFRDLQQVLPTLLMLWFFLTPILYAPELLPDQLYTLAMFNPLAGLIGDIRSALLEGQLLPGPITWTVLVAAIALCLVALAFFRRLSPYFEDFL